MNIREKRTYSGKSFEPEFYPVRVDGRKYSRGTKKGLSRAAQKNYNDKVARRYLRRLLDTNFNENDYYCTFTYRDSELPTTYAEVKKDINNFFKRVRRARKKAELKEELKYIYAIEYKMSRKTGKARLHLHLVINGGLSRQEVKRLWGKGDIKRVEELQPDEHGFQQLAIYLCKEWTNELLPENRKRYTPSRNLKKPKTPPPKDGVFSARYLEKLCKERIDDAEFWERRYKGYRFIEAEATYDEDWGIWHLSVFMRKRD